MKKAIVTNPMIGLCFMQVCADKEATDEEILAVANAENPSGTTNGWSEVVHENHENKKLRPVVCSDDPNRNHFILIC